MTLDDLDISPGLRQRLSVIREDVERVLAHHPKYEHEPPNKSTLYRWANHGIKVFRPRNAKGAAVTPADADKRAENAVKARERYKDGRRWAWTSWRRLRRKAALRGMDFDLEIEDIIVPAVCPVLGIRLEAGGLSYREQVNSPSVDRIDNRKGYVKGNVRVISKRANSLKSDATIEEVEAVLAYMKENIVPPES